MILSSYFKLLNKNKSTIILYTLIFLGLSIMFTTSGNTSTQIRKPRINLQIEDTINEDFEEYINNNFILIDIEENMLTDALIYRYVDAIVYIDSEFNKSLEEGNPVLKVDSLEDSYSSILTVTNLNNFLNTYKSTSTSEEQSKLLEEILNSEVEITLNEKEEDNIIYYLNFINYPIIVILILMIGNINNSYKKEYIVKRFKLSGMSETHIKREIFKGHLILASIVFLIYLLLTFLMFSDSMFSTKGIFYIINLLVFTISITSFAFLVAEITKNREAQNGIANVVSLGSSFISGSFVPQFLLSNSILFFASFFPSYWYIKNNEIVTNQVVNGNYILNIVVMIAFALIFATLKKVKFRK